MQNIEKVYTQTKKKIKCPKCQHNTYLMHATNFYAMHSLKVIMQHAFSDYG